MNDSNTDTNTHDFPREKKTYQDWIMWRRSKVLEYLSKGYTQAEIVDILHVSHPTISRDVSYIREHSRDNIRTFIDKRLPEEIEKAFTSYDTTIKIASSIADNTTNDKVKLDARDLVNKTRAAILEICNNTDLINYVLELPANKNKKLTDKVSVEESDSNPIEPEEEESQSFEEPEEEEIIEDNASRPL
jgi:transcriptional regulator